MSRTEIEALVRTIVQQELRQLRRTGCGQLAAARKATAETRFGYPFGVDGSISMSDAADRLGVVVRTVYNLVSDGKLRKGKIRRKAVICARSLKRYLESIEV